MKKITFKRNEFRSCYEVYVNGEKTNYEIHNWKKDLNCYTVFNGDERISGYEFLSQAKEQVEYYIRADEKRNNVYDTQYIVINLHTREILCNTNDKEYAREVADRNSAYMISVKLNGFNTPMGLNGCLY